MKAGSGLILLAVCVPWLASAGTVPPCTGAGCDYDYVLSLTGLSGGAEDVAVTWTFTFDSAGPFEYNAPANSLLDAYATGTPKSGWAAGSPLTSSGGGYPNGFSADLTNDEPTIDIYFEQSAVASCLTTDTCLLADPNWVDFHIEEPDSFWLNPGTVDLDPGAVTYTINGVDPITCTVPGDCTLTTATSPIAPEPGTLPLMGTVAIAALGFTLRKKAKSTMGSNSRTA